MGDLFAEFVEAYNADLALFGCAARVAITDADWHDGSLELLDADGRHLGYVPRTVEPLETAAFIVIIEKQRIRLAH